jgi:cytochrome P450
VARAAGAVAAAATREHLPGIRRPGVNRALAAATDDLVRLLGARSPDVAGMAVMLAVAAVNTTTAGIPRAVAWCADCRMWPDADCGERREVLASELLRVTAPTALLPRAAAAAGTVGGHPIRKGDRLILVARHAAGAHRTGPDCDLPAPPQVAQLVFGAGPHACPGAALAKALLADTLQMLAPHRPVVVRARADRRSGLPGWESLVIRASPATRQRRGQ